LSGEYFYIDYTQGNKKSYSNQSTNWLGICLTPNFVTPNASESFPDFDLDAIFMPVNAR
jgi:hypothetical protein